MVGAGIGWLPLLADGDWYGMWYKCVDHMKCET